MPGTVWVERRLDLGRANGRHFVGIASVGFDSDVQVLANRTRFVRGAPVYTYAALRTLLSWKPCRFTVEIDGENRLAVCPRSDRSRGASPPARSARARTYWSDSYQARAASMSSNRTTPPNLRSCAPLLHASASSMLSSPISPRCDRRA